MPTPFKKKENKMSLKFSRHSGIINPELLDMPIVICGVGSVGSFATLALAKMGCSDLTIIDHDTVEEENVGPQLYGVSDIGQKKVDVLKKLIKENVGTNIKTYSVKAETILPSLTKVILVLALDSLEARKKCLIASTPTPPALVIDMRMKGELISAYLSFDKDSTKNFTKSFDSSIKVDEGKCSEKAIAYNTLICGGLVASLVKKFVNKEPLPHSLVVDLEMLTIN